MSFNKRNGNGPNGKRNEGGVATAPAPVRHRPAESTTATTSSRVESKPSRPQVTRQAIAEAAYFIWLKRGGNEVSNWLEAEAALKAKNS